MSKEMKDSGVEWIGEIPKDWEIKPLKHILKERKEKNDPIITKDILSLTNDRGVIPYDEKGNQGNKSKNDLTGYKIAYPNDIVLNSMNVVIGSVGKSKYFGCVSPVYYMLYPINKNFDIDYYNFIFQTKVFQNNLKGYGNGILEIRMRISMEKLNTVCLPVPSIKLQREIVNFLNEKVGEIDRLIDNDKKSIEEYKQYKQSVITEAVTKGLDSNVEMKDSGIEWIEEIPKDWDIQRLKNIFEFGKGLPITKENLKESGVSVISYGQIHSKLNNGTEILQSLIRFVDNEYLNTNQNSLVEKGDFIFADTSEDLDGCGNCVYINKNEVLFAGYHTIILRSLCGNDNKYLSYLFKTDLWRSQIRSRVSGIKLFSITQKILKEITVILPKMEEQDKVVKYLDIKCLEIDNIISKKEKIIIELESYKKSLIYEYVTGKKEVQISKPSIVINCKDKKFAKATLVSKIIDELGSTVKGRTKIAKTLYLTELSLGLNFNSEYDRRAAGPLDKEYYKLEAIIKRNKWFNIKEYKNKKRSVTYFDGENKDKYKRYYDKYFGKYNLNIERVINILKGLTTDEAEMIATAYASWNDFILKDKKFTKEDIVEDIFSWNETKKRFSKEQWLEILNRLSELDLVPVGNGILTKEC